MKYKPIFLLMVFCCFLFPAAFDYAAAQNINIDFGSHYATPSNIFGAASGQVGVWNTLGLGATSNLHNISGATTTVVATVNAGNGDGWSPTSCGGDIGALLDDNFFTDQATWSIVLSGLTNGVYSVYLYGPSHPSVETGNMLVNGVPVTSISGDSCTFLAGTTYTTVKASVNSGTLTIAGTKIASYAGLAGLQIIEISQQKTSGIAIYRKNTGTWYLDLNGNRGWDGPGVDAAIGWGGDPSDMPVVGDWNGSGTTKIGVFRQSTGTWYLDLNGNRGWDGPGVDAAIGWGGDPSDMPVVGDWNGSGTTKIGVFRQSTGTWYLDLNGNGVWDGPGVDALISWGGDSSDIPVVGKW